MLQFKFPVLHGNQTVFPKDHICPWCGARKLSDPPGMAILNAGALKPTAPECYTMALEDAAFMTLTWHSNDPANYDDATIRIADCVDTGQFELYFCSTACLRAFLNYCVDELERRRGSKSSAKNKPRVRGYPKGRPRK
jgi:hypothetical protein